MVIPMEPNSNAVATNAAAAAVAAQAAADAAQGTADGAVADAATAQTAAEAAQTDADTAQSAAATAQAAADAAQADADTAQGTANTAATNATTALSYLPTYVVAPDEWTDASGLFSVVDGLLMLEPTSFSSLSDLTSGAPPGYEYINSARLASGDHGTTTAGAQTVTLDTTTTAYWDTSQTCFGLFKTRTGSVRAGLRQFIIARIALVGAGAGGEGSWIIIKDANTPGNFARVGLEDTGPSTLFVSLINTNIVFSATASQNAAWFAIVLDGTTVETWYADSDAATIPAASSWVLYESKTGAFAVGDTIKAGQVHLGAGSGHTATISGWQEVMVPSGFGESTAIEWGAEAFSTAGYVLSRQVTVPAGVTITDAAVRAALTSAVATSSTRQIPGTGWTARAKRGGAPSGAYAALASVVQEASSGEDLYLDLKFTSDGTTRGALRQVNLRAS